MAAANMSFHSKSTLTTQTHLDLFIHFLLPVSTGALPDDASRSVRSEKHDPGSRALLASSCLIGWQTLWSASHIPLNSTETVFGVLPMLSVVLSSKFHNYIIIFLPFGKPWWWQICLHGDRHSSAYELFLSSQLLLPSLRECLLHCLGTSQCCVRPSVPSQQKKCGPGSGYGIICYYHTGHHMKVVSQLGRKAYWRFQW